MHLEQPATIAKASTPPPLHHSASTPGNMDDNDVSPAGGQQETNWESMKPRDKQGDEIVRRTEALLPRWKGPGPDGWMVLHDHVRNFLPCGTDSAGADTFRRMPRIRTVDMSKFSGGSIVTRISARKSPRLTSIRGQVLSRT